MRYACGEIDRPTDRRTHLSQYAAPLTDNGVIIVNIRDAFIAYSELLTIYKLDIKLEQNKN